MVHSYESFCLRSEKTQDNIDSDNGVLQSFLRLPRPLWQRTLALRTRDEEDGEVAKRVHSWSSRSSELAADEALCEAIRPSGDEPDAIAGNIYKFFAFMQFGVNKHKSAGGASLFEPPATQKEFISLMIGLGFVILIQLFAPLAIFGTNLVQLVQSVDVGAWRSYDFTQWMTVLLAWAFLFCFILNAYNGTCSDLRTMRKVCRMEKALRYFDQPVNRCWLLADAAINSYVSVSLSICMFAILFQETNAKEVVFDSLSLAFLMNIDDMASDLGFLGGVWDDSKVGRFYDQLRVKGIFKEAGLADDDDLEGGTTLTMPMPNALKRRRNSEDESDDEDVESFVHVTSEMLDDEFDKIPKQIYHCAMWILLVLLVLAVPAPFLLASKAKKDTAWSRVLDPAKLANLTTGAEEI